MSTTTLRILIVAAWAVVVGAALASVRGHERTLAEGEVVLLALAPVDPRSLMQGDYMALRFAVSNALLSQLHEAGTGAGTDTPLRLPRFAYLAIDAERRATFAGAGDALRNENGVVSIRIRDHGTGPTVGPNAFFFQEGTAVTFEAAKWGEFRLAPDGTALLTHMRGEDLQRLGAASAFPELD